jgi:hypothetical protein
MCCKKHVTIFLEVLGFILTIKCASLGLVDAMADRKQPIERAN